MKKALGILSVLVLITVMMISCNAEQKLDDTVGVSFNVSSSRDLNVENQPFESVSSENLTWYYHGVKMSDEQFITGQSGTGEKYWTRISTGIELANTQVTFSQGQWFFEIKAMKGNTQMYYGKTNGNVLLTKENRTISISVSPFVSGVKGTLKIESVYIDPKDLNSPNVAPNRLFIDGAPKNFTVDEGGESISYTDEVEPGTYTVEVKRVGYDTGIVLASASKTVIVYSGLTTTIKGSVEEDITSGTFDPQPVKPEGSKPVKVQEGSENAVVEFVNVTPTMEVDKSTTVTIPSSVVPSATNITLDIAVKDSESVANNSFNVTTDKGVAASISLTMKNGDEAITDFGTNEVTVETYIETGLSGVTVKYNGTGAAPSDVVYDPATGKLTFTTTHFSEFYVVADAQAKIDNVGYCLLQTAFNVAENNSTISLLADVETPKTSYYVENKNLTLNLNGHELSGSGYDGTLCVKSNATLTINGDGEVIGNDDNNYGMAIWAVGENAKVIINGGTYSNTLTHDDYQMDLIYASRGGNVVINGGVFNCTTPAWTLNVRDDDYASGASNITVCGGEFHGFNPAECETEGERTNFIPEWYRSNIKTGSEDIYEVSAIKQVLVKTDAELSTALTSTVNEGETIIVNLTSGNFTLPSGSCKNKNVKLVGSGEGTVLSILDYSATYQMSYQNGATLVFENMTIKGQNGGDFGGLAHTNKVTYNNCKILGKITLYAGVEKFINCTFENKNDYAIWTWGGKEVTLTGCTFNSGGKAVNLYGGAGSSETPTTVLTVTNCVFNDDDTLVDAKKAAIEIGNDYGATYKLNVTNTTVNGFAINPEGISTGTTLWANKKSMDADHLFVTVNNKKVYGN